MVAYTEYPSDPRVRKEAEALAAGGYEIVVIALTPKTGPSPRVLSGVRLYELPLVVNRGTRARYLYQYCSFFLMAGTLLLALHLRKHFDAIHVHSLPDFLVFCAVPERLLGVPVVLDLHEAMPELVAARFQLSMNSPIVGIARALEWISSTFATRVIAVSALRSNVISARGADSRKIIVIPNSPERSVSATIPAAVADLQTLLEGRWILVQAGGINPERDLETLVRAAGVLSQAHPVSVVLFGRGEEEYLLRLKALARCQGPELDLRIGGWIPHEHVAHYLALSLVGVASYERNPLTEFAAPNKVFEYAAARIPLVLPNLKALKSEWGEAALFYEPGDPRELAERMHEVIESPSLRSALTAKATTILQMNDWAKAKRTLTQTFEALTMKASE